MVVEADRIGQISNTAFDLQRVAHRVVAKNADATARDIGQAYDHKEGSGLAGTVRPEQTEDLAATDRERHAVHGCGAAITLGEIAYFDNDIAHRRPLAAIVYSYFLSCSSITCRNGSPCGLGCRRKICIFVGWLNEPLAGSRV